MNTDLPGPTPKSTSRIVGPIVLWLGVSGGVALSVLRALVWSHGSWNAEVAGYAASGVIVPGLLAYLIGGRKRVRSPIRFGITFFVAALIVFLLEFSNRTPDPRAQVADIIKEAAGTKPIDSETSGSDSAMDALTREVMQDILGRVKTYQQHAAPLQADLGQLYAASSFSSPSAMQRAVTAVRSVTTLDHDLLQQLESLPDRVQLQVSQSHLSESEKQDFLNGFNKSLVNSKQLDLQKQADEIETQWRDETIALYEFTLGQPRSFKVQGTQLVFNDENARAKFNEKVRNATDLRRRLRELQAQLQQLQRENFEKLGLTPKDVGLHR